MPQSPGGLTINKRAYLSAFGILTVLLLFAGILTRIVPAGSYARATAGGAEMLVPDSFHWVIRAPYPVWRWFTAPVEVLWGPDRLTIITIILFILVIGGAFAVLEKGEVLRRMIALIVGSFGRRKYLLMGIIVLFFMSLGSILGIFEEVVPLVPILVHLAFSLGWDSLTGLGMSLLAAGFGFSAAISNPFSIGISQRIAGLPLFSGALIRGVVFLTIYLILYLFLARHARRVERDPKSSPVYAADEEFRSRYHGRLSAVADATPAADTGAGPGQTRAVRWFVGFLALIFVVMVSTPLVPGLSDYSLPIIALLFLSGGIIAGRLAGLDGPTTARAFLTGVGGMAPGIPLILMAMSIKHIIAGAGIMDTILYRSATLISGTTPYGAIFMVFLLILIMELFIGSSSAKAFLVMPLIAPLADLVGLTRQSAVLAFSFADGFSNVLYPTNPVLLISLGLTVVSFPTWFKWTIKLQLLVLVITSLFMCLAVAMKLGPF